MNKYFKTLELNRILEMLSNEAFSEDAKENALSIVPVSYTHLEIPPIIEPIAP